MALEKAMSGRLINGSCHCGNIRFALQWPDGEDTVAARVCGCDFCTRHGGAWTSHADAKLAVGIGDPSLVSKYRFATATADFIVCSTCGVVPLVLCEIDETCYAVVNVNCFEDIDELQLTRCGTDFDGEGQSDRLRRRKRNWIPDVSFEFDGA